MAEELPYYLTGVGKIAAERSRQISTHGWTPGHDDGHEDNELILAAVAYCFTNPAWWPWEASEWKPKDEQRENLAKAGALIAAEIDRLDRRAFRHGQ